MSSSTIFFLVEGDDDERFLSEIIQPFFEKKYFLVKIVQYAKLKKDKLCSLLRSINSMGAKHVCFADLDDMHCVTKKKEELKGIYSTMDLNKTVIIIKEIESWYLAGLQDATLKKYRIKTATSTNGISKELFNKIIPDKYDSRRDFMIEILKDFSIDTAKKNNSSFAYFMEKHVI